jgi:hypothetical protein
MGQGFQLPELRFPCSFPAKTVKVNGKLVEYNENATKNSWNYNGEELTTVVLTSEYNVSQKTIVEVEFLEGDITELSGKKGQFSDLLKAVKVAANVRLEKAKFDFQEMVRISQTGTAITYNPSSIRNEISNFNMRYKNAIQLLDKGSKEEKDLHGTTSNIKEYKLVYDLLNAKSNLK